MNDGRKKLAFLFMGPEYEPEKFTAKFEMPSKDTYIFSVRNFEEAVVLAKRLVEDGFGALEVCGAFGPELTKKLIEATGRKLAIGYVTHFPEDDDLFDSFFGKK